MSTEIGTTYEQGDSLWRDRDRVDGCTLRITAPAVLRGENSFSIGCQNFGLNELLVDGKGSVGALDTARSQAPVTFQGVVRGREFRVSDRRVLGLADVVTHMTKAEVISTTPTANKVALQPGVYFCRTHPDRHFFAVSVAYQNGVSRYPDGAVQRIGMTTHNVHLAEHGVPAGVTGFARWPSCRPERGHTYTDMFGATPNRDRTYNVAVTEHQFAGTPRVP